jgi:polyisoprenoid-binding protein YceI
VQIQTGPQIKRTLLAVAAAMTMLVSASIFAQAAPMTVDKNTSSVESINPAI